VTTSCPTCRAEVPQGARFCPSCGAALAVDAGLTTERKVVTTLFADLVGFTALGERADPEDIDAALRSYYEMARDTIEHFGGVVEKFIGDAVVGLFGVPLAHEDDAERAVRAGLEIVARMTELPPIGDDRLQVRAAVNTGPALVRLHTRPETGDGVLVGDAVNTAARLLSAAPTMAVVVGAATQRLTERSIAYEQLPAFAAKGKAKPVERWLAHGVIARRGVDANPREEPAMVGREVELAILTGLLDKAIAARSPQQALVVGEAGIGKSRLVREFFRRVDTNPDLLCTWRQGRCAPYGVGTALQSLREIVTADAGILHTDAPTTIEAKLRRALGVDAADEWFMNQMRPLVGLPSTPTDRESSFAAWRRFIEGMARIRPTILVFEDLHWASETTLDFLRHLARGAGDVPLLVLGTARPEFLQGREDPGVGITRIDLKSLDRRESGRLAHGLAGALGTPEIVDLVAERSGGNPLFIEELVRESVAPTSALETSGEPEGQRDPDVPESILMLIGARLDALPADHRSLLSDASVIGPVFWPDALCHLGNRELSAVVRLLNELEEREFIRRLDASTMTGAAEYKFWHAFTQDVGYDRLPRPLRAAKHAAAARWMQGVADDVATDLTQMAAYHYSTAMSLATASHDEASAEALRPAAIDALALAGERSLALDVQSAAAQLARAADLAVNDAQRRPQVLAKWAGALRQKGEFREAANVLDEAAEQFTAAGDEAAARALATQRWYVHWLLADGQEGVDDIAGVPEGLVPSIELVEVLDARASKALYTGRTAEGLAFIDRAISMCADLGLPEPMHALSARGALRCDLGDGGGLEDHRRALDLAHERGDASSCCAFYANLGEYMNTYRGPRAALELHEAGLHLARSRRDEMAECYCRALTLVDLVLAGEWDSCDQEAPELDTYLQAREDNWDLQLVQATTGLLHVWRGNAVAARPLTASAEEHSRLSHIVSTRFTCLVAHAVVEAALGKHREAARLVDLCGDLERAAHMNDAALRMPELARLCDSLGRWEQMKTLAGRLPPSRAYDKGTLAFVDGLLSRHEGRPREAAQSFAVAERCWARLGIPYERGMSLLAGAKCLVDVDDAGAGPALLQAEEIFRRLGALPALSETEAAIATLKG
jgi:class 3 adenylate cyclase/tetratricopeptide (TPR) repeat protein